MTRRWWAAGLVCVAIAFPLGWGAVRGGVSGELTTRYAPEAYESGAGEVALVSDDGVWIVRPFDARPLARSVADAPERAALVAGGDRLLERRRPDGLGVVALREGGGGERVLSRPGSARAVRLAAGAAVWIEARFAGPAGREAYAGTFRGRRDRRPGTTRYDRAELAFVGGASGDAEGNVLLSPGRASTGESARAVLWRADGGIEGLPPLRGVPLLLGDGRIVAVEEVGARYLLALRNETRTRLVRLEGGRGRRRWVPIPVRFERSGRPLIAWPTLHV